MASPSREHLDPPQPCLFALIAYSQSADRIDRMCTYQTPDGKRCPRSIVGGEPHCSLHNGCNRGPDDDLPDNPQFPIDFSKVIAARDGDWRGFVFPRGVTLPQQVDFAVDARGCQFSAFDHHGVVFKGSADFSDSIFRSGMILRGVVFERAVLFERCHFAGPVDLLHVRCEQNTSFYRAEFSGRTILRINFKGPANLNEVVFRDGVHFAGWREVTGRCDSALLGMTSMGAALLVSGQKPTLRQRLISSLYAAGGHIKRTWLNTKKRAARMATSVRSGYRTVRRRFAMRDPDTEVFHMFEVEGQLQSVVFMKAEQTVFSQVDLSRVYFRGTNLRGVQFHGVDWWQPKLRRNGLYEELFIRYSLDGPFRYHSLPVLEETCRNIRVALEESRSFNVASDFYVAEMEAARARLPLFRRHLLSVHAIYRIVSNYGTSVPTAIRVLAYLILLHVATTLWLQGETDVSLLMGSMLDTALRSLMILVLQADLP